MALALALAMAMAMALALALALAMAMAMALAMALALALALAMDDIMNIIIIIKRWLKLDSQSMLNGGLRLNHFWQAEHRNVARGE